MCGPEWLNGEEHPKALPELRHLIGPVRCIISLTLKAAIGRALCDRRSEINCARMEIPSKAASDEPRYHPMLPVRVDSNQSGIADMTMHGDGMMESTGEQLT